MTVLNVFDRSFLGFLFLITLFGVSLPIQFDVAPWGQRCISEHFKKNDIVKGGYSVTNSPSRQMKFWVENPNRVHVYNAEDIQTGTYAFVADLDGEYQFCFSDAPRPGFPLATEGTELPRRVSIRIEVEQEKQKLDNIVANKENLKPLELALQKIELVSSDIRLDMRYMREREAQHRDANETANARVAWLSVFTIVVLIFLSLFQAYYMRSYFARKKLL
jgi:hypothetical protein